MRWRRRSAPTSRCRCAITTRSRSRPAADATLLLMPAWTDVAAEASASSAARSSPCFPTTPRPARPSVYGSYLLLSGDTGEPLAVIDGRALTAWRTACASALAARYLAREDAVASGDGRRRRAGAASRARACEVRPIKRVTLWNRTAPRAIATGFALAGRRHRGRGRPTISKTAVREADIVSCATLVDASRWSSGAWLKKGAHLDLVGGFTPKMREADDEAIRRARVYVDTRAGALKEAGDIVDPLQAARSSAERHPGRPVRALPRQGQGPHSAGTKSRCSNRSAPRSRTWPRRCWCGGALIGFV